MKENQRITITKRLLKEALLDILKKKEIDKISVSELCTKAGINRATFYRHYEIPHDILLEIQDDFIEDSQIFKTDPETITSITELAKEFQRICCYLKEHAELTKLLMRCNSSEDFTKLIDGYCKNILLIKYKDHFDDESIHLLVSGLANGGYALLKTWLLEDIKKTPDEMADLIVKFISIGSKIL